MGKFSRLGNALYEGDVSIDFVGRKWLWYAISGRHRAARRRRPLLQGPQLRHRVQGRRRVHRQPAGQPGRPRPTPTRSATRSPTPASTRRPAPIVNTSGSSSIRVQTEELTNDEATQVTDGDRRGRSTSTPTRTSPPRSVGASWGAQVAKRALTGLVVFLVLVVLFIWAYFREWKMSVAAIVALAHDLVITDRHLRPVRLRGHPGDGHRPADHPRLLALRHRGRLRQGAGEHQATCRQSRRTYAELANLAVNQTLVRSINTSIVALLPVGAILYVGVVTLGSGALKDLALALFVGMAAGAYSSIFIATPLAVQLKSRREGDHPAGRPGQGPRAGATPTATPTCRSSPRTCRSSTTPDGADGPTTGEPASEPRRAGHGAAASPRGLRVRTRRTRVQGARSASRAPRTRSQPTRQPRSKRGK